ncbi:hypothetical protein [Streptomyces sp. NPDC059063]|uniref:hypothetical protein n=1 Tax=unclassified Streptomyces TaxID=2593676 RepID=UPI0036C95396
MDPVVAGAAATVLVSVVSGVVRIVREWLGREVELARVAHEALTERVRCAAPGAAFQESSGAHHVRVVPVRPESGGGRHGGCRER